MSKSLTLFFFLLAVICLFFMGRSKDKPNLSVKEVNFLTGYSLYSARVASDLYPKKVPVSVIMAQAILESGWGESKSAKENKSLFGWKSGKSWTGMRGKNGDGTCRKYLNWNESYVDHVRSLNQYKWYAKCFETRGLTKKSISIKWVECLEDAGYCKNDYATKLKRVINQYKLYQYD